MIEFCTKKRMGIAILALIFVSVIVLVIENNLSLGHDIMDATHPPGSDNHSAECWLTSDFTVLHACHPCNSLEKVDNKHEQHVDVSGQSNGTKMDNEHDRHVNISYHSNGPEKIQAKCRGSGYFEMVRCTSSKGVETDAYRSCPKLSWVEERNFWVFEVVMAVVGLGAYSVVHIRQKTLDRLLLEKVHKQIAAGV